jgi:2-iminoacetate synthase
MNMFPGLAAMDREVTDMDTGFIDHERIFSYLKSARPSDRVETGYIPSFCTGCYRLGRTGADFMDLAKPGLIKRYCLPNAMTTFKEYLVHYASPQTRIAGEALIERMLGDIPDEKTRDITVANLGKIEAGSQDLYL